MNGKATPFPQVDFDWEIRNPEGNSVWSQTTTGRWDMQRSKYITSGGGPVTTYDFGNKPMRTAIVEEILATGAGLETIPEIPYRVLSAGGKPYPLPRTLTWTVESSQAAAGEAN